jgi:hypothetical protein
MSNNTQAKTVRESINLGTEAREDRSLETSKSPELGGSREKISGALAEGQSTDVAENMESGEVKEVASEGGEIKGDSAKGSGGKGASAGQGNGAMTFTFDVSNLPPAPEMIRKIEEYLRAEIRQLEKQAQSYKGGWFRTPDYYKHNETVIKIREKTVILKRLLYMAVDAIKKIFLQMFGART